MKTCNFHSWIVNMFRERGPIVLALDYTIRDQDELFRRSINTLEAVAYNVCGIKINQQLALPLGLYPKVEEIVNRIHKLGLPAIMDCKINDVGNTNKDIAKRYFEAGFDAVIANPFVGWEEGLQPVFETAEEAGKGVILLVYMSHRGATEGYGQRVIDPKTGQLKLQYLVFAEKAMEWDAEGVVVGATYPEKIAEVNNILKGKVPIYSPGVGTQGGDAKLALDAGSKFLIVGRSIISSDDPGEAARRLREEVSKRSS
jgi:orotidine-5'-phosphate decarboxylase